MPTSTKRPTDRKKKQQQNLKATSAKAWRNSSALGRVFTLDLPSGNVATIRRPGLEAMISNGDIPDSLLGIAQGAIDKGQGKKTEEDLDEAAVMAMASDPEKWGAMLDAVDRIAARVFVEPKVRYHKEEHPIDGTWTAIGVAGRNPDFLYTDEIEMDDKFFVFDFACGDSADLERFHAKHADRVEYILDGDQVS